MAKLSTPEKERKMQLVFLRVKASPNGITEKEIEDATGIGRRTINDYLNDMKLDGKVEKEGRLWFLGDYQEIRSLKLELSPEEAYTYYLGSRLFVKQHDKRNQLAENALMKLADALATNRLVGQEIAQAARELSQRPGDSGYETIFQTMVRGYLNRRRVAVSYRSLKGNLFETTFETYLMEPSAIGYATYVIGDCSLQKKRVAYKLERIESAQLLSESYRIPDDFPGLEALRNSWSIIMGEKTERVELRFAPEVRSRVEETQWHPSQKSAEDTEKSGWLRWWVDVADTLDMEPWIRSWGADVEVIGPVELRETLKGEARAMAEMYGWYVSAKGLAKPSLEDTFSEFFGE